MNWKDYQNTLFTDVRADVNAKVGSDIFKALSLWIMINSAFYRKTNFNPQEVVNKFRCDYLTAVNQNHMSRAYREIALKTIADYRPCFTVMPDNIDRAETEKAMNEFYQKLDGRLLRVCGEDQYKWLTYFRAINGTFYKSTDFKIEPEVASGNADFLTEIFIKDKGEEYLAAVERILSKKEERIGEAA